ncbi:NAD(P)H-dependent oxidoreductase [Nocardioides bruguierae]|uniref:NAD(P)H-dependent oxidoreductase n=1 Tax=Nocardioides bruguierae TaxID=2945102 RepID=A0A9X2D9S2_9ACTN|nr:NAD(P)H-dependent oxidoreductase [Nocardioides bruguierae]MCL8027666.1 NAD(P)H-dependent oxidoreductase [Nocardioides bruguierae]MCM0621973.1 NAD(P)H-dependent oxidoreductase [Nocardioides bruguierae]
MKAVAVIGNPKPQSRTRAAAEALLTALGYEPDVVEVAEIGPGVLGWGDPAVAAAKEKIAEATLVVVASPTFKATYTGLLKCFLDQFDGGTGLAGKVVVPLMLGAGPAHAMAPELTLKPVLAELGASCPTAALYLLDKAYETDGALEAFVERWSTTVHALAPLDQEVPA